MALITCPECGHQVSNQATKCPKCGYPFKKNLWQTLNKIPQKQKYGLFVTIAILLFLSIFNLLFAICNKKDYAVAKTIENILSSDAKAQIHDCKVFHYSPEQMKFIYNNGFEIPEECIIVYVVAQSKNEFSDFEDTEYIGTYDLKGNCLTWFDMKDSSGSIFDDEISNFIENSNGTDWFGWHSYTKKEIEKAKKINNKQKVFLLPLSTSKLTDKEKEQCLEKYINLDISLKDLDAAERHLKELTNTKTYSKYQSIIENEYFKDGKKAYDNGDISSALTLLEKAKNNANAQLLIKQIQDEEHAEKTEEEYQNAISYANHHKYKEAKKFFINNEAYKDSKEFLTLIEEAEQSKWDGYWVADNFKNNQKNSHIRILATVFSYDNSDVKGVANRVTMFDNWNSINLEYFQENLGQTWVQENNKLIEAITEEESMWLKKDKLIVKFKTGEEVSYHRDNNLEE